MRRFLALFLLSFAQPSLAASIDIIPQNPNAAAVVIVKGVLGLDDIEAFQFKVAGLSKAVVVLDSDGGNLIAGIRIGTLIRLRNFITLVPSGAVCASSCAFAWLGGASRFMSPDARIGFHAAYRNEDGQPIETGAGNAILGAYLNQIGLSEIAIVYITKAPPHGMTWLTKSDAARHQIDVQVFLAPQAPTVSSASPTGTIQQDVIGPGSELEKRTRAFVASLHAAWSATAPLGSPILLEQIYAEQVRFYGKNLHRSAIIAEKNRFASRWPQRKYDLREPSVGVQCADRATCTAVGIVDWATFNPLTMARARGSADFHYSIEWSGGSPRIIAEMGSVIERESQAALAQQAGVGWWVVLASFGAAGTDGTNDTDLGIRRTIGAAYLCGFNAFNDASEKFAGFTPGYKVVVVGPSADRTEAANSQQRLSYCIPGAYLKHASYSN